jgi:hypothetical protein
MEKVRNHLLQFCEESLQAMWGKEAFDYWLCLDAGASFAYAFTSHLQNVTKDVQTPYGKLCVYELQRHVRENKDYTLESLQHCASAFVNKVVDSLELTQPTPIAYEYSYFI